ncbi:hypothetical protein C6989_05455 [Nitrosopumilus sp. b2]|nr:hypothetical protein C6989_05455 [Nitrosopumilus sp. b2]
MQGNYQHDSHNRRAVSDIISALLLLSITITGGVIIFSFFEGFDVTSVVGGSSDPSLQSVKLVGYDTRDSTGLHGISTLDNQLDSKLCTSSCASDKDLIPSNGGTEFITLTLRNSGLESIFISKLLINDIQHVFDAQTAGAELDASTNASLCTISCPYPKSGKFSITSTNNAIQLTNSEVVVGQDARLIVKLSSEISSDITLLKPLKIQIDTGNLQFKEFIIQSGGAR